MLLTDAVTTTGSTEVVGMLDAALLAHGAFGVDFEADPSASSIWCTHT